MSPTENRKTTSKWSFLRWNSLFSSTPFAGYSFIEDAASIAEVVFWYILLLVFTTITINNVVSTFAHYHAQPTTISTSMVSTTGQVHVTNLTLTINLNIFEFLTHNSPTKLEIAPWPLENYSTSKLSANALLFLACEAASPTKNDGYLSQLMRMEIWSEWYLHFLQWLDPPKENEPFLDYPLGDKRILYDWSQSLLWSSHRLMNFFQKIKYEAVTPEIFNDLLFELLFYLMGHRIPYKHIYLMSLTAIKSGIDPRLAFFDQLGGTVTSMDVSHDPELSQLQQQLKEKDQAFASKFKHGSKDFLKSLNISSYQLYQWTTAGLNELIHISTYPGTKIFLRDFSFSDFSLHAQDSKIKLSVELQLPPDTKEMTVEVYSLLANSFDTLFRMLDMATRNTMDPSDPYHINNAFCEWSELPLNKDLWRYMFHSFFNNYEHASLVIESGRGSSVTLEPLYKYVISLKTSMHFLSNIENCHNGTHQECNENCMNDHHKEKCGCYPWPLYYLNEKQDNMCSEPCKEAEKMYQQCHVHCERKLKRLCDIYNYDMDQKGKVYDRMTLYDHNKLRPLFAFKIVPEIVHYPRIIEDYSMTSSGLLSALGGQLDLWMSINVIGSIHLLVYLFKQMRNALDPKSRTGRTIRSLFNKHNNTVEQKTGKGNAIELQVESKLLALECKFDRNQLKFEKHLKKIYTLIKAKKSELQIK